MTTDTTQFVDLKNARYADQRAVMEEIVAAGHCPFCQDHWYKYNTPEATLKDGKHWFLVKNRWPYVNTKQHFLLITKEHIETFGELSDNARVELFELTDWAINEFTIPGGALAIRFGDTRHSAGSVQHLHAQLVHPDVENPDFENAPVRLRIGRGKK